MRCPICNCKMKHKTICPYCKITGEQVKGASNQLAKVALKNGRKKEVVTSTTIPFDINYTRLLLIAIFTGFVGGHNYYVGKYYKGIFCSASMAFALIMVSIDSFFGTSKYYVFELFKEISIVLAALTVFLWLYDIAKLAFHSFGVPVVVLDEKQAAVNVKTREQIKKRAKND